jgi:hypothetical protein
MNEQARRIVVDAVNRSLGTCPHCGRLKRLTADGLIVGHYLPGGIRVSRSAIPSVGTGRKKVKCTGSGKPPRRPLGERT